MISVTSSPRYITSKSRYHPLYQSRSAMYIRGLIPQNFAEFAEAVPIKMSLCKSPDIKFGVDQNSNQNFDL